MAENSRTTILLALFESLRSEIARRSEAQANAIQLAITALGVLGSLAFTKDAGGDKRFLLLIPLITACLSLIWFDHSANIQYIGSFIRDEIFTSLNEENQDVPDWEAYIKYKHDRPLVVLRTFASPFLIFILVPALALLVCWLNVKNHDELFYIVAFTDIVMLAISLMYFLPLLFIRFQWDRAVPAAHAGPWRGPCGG